MNDGREVTPQVVAPPDVELQAAMLDAMFGDAADQYADLITPPDVELQQAMLEAMFGEEADQYADLIINPEVGHEELGTVHVLKPQERAKRRPRTPVAMRRIGWTAVGAAAVVVVALIGTSLSRPERPQVVEAAITTDADPITTESTASTAVTTEATTTTTEAPTPRTFEAQPGEHVGTLIIDDACLEVEVYEFDESEKTQDKIGTGAAVIDRLVPDDNPVTSCEPVESYAHEVRTNPSNPAYNPEFMTRADWVRNSSRGPVTQWQPIAGHERNANGPLSVYPGQPGNAVISGHGSTYSSPFTDMGTVENGQRIVFQRADGGEFVYEVVGQELTTDFNTIHDYTHPETKATLTIYNCSDETGNTGSDATRLVTRAVLVETLR